MKHKAGLEKRDVLVVLGCAVFLLANLGAVGSSGRRRAKEAVCLSNLLRWGQLWDSYTRDHDGKFPPRGGGSVWGEENMGAWPYVIWLHAPKVSPRLRLCPEATKPVMWGPAYPFAAWYSTDGDVTVYGSYTVNFWLANNPGQPEFWGTASIREAACVPLLADGNWKDAEPYPDDEPFPTREQMTMEGWTPNTNEMRRVCVDRHGCYLNGVFVDLSARKIGLKELWMLKWHRQWPPEGGFPTGGWPEWMQNFKDY